MIEILNVDKSYNGYVVLRDVNLLLRRGNVIGFESDNGSGKTVLLKIICGLIQPDSGMILWNNKTIGKDIDFPLNTGIMIEEPGFYQAYSARANLRLLAAHRKCMDNQEVDEAIKMVGLDPRSRKPVGKYSMGMRQRLCFAQAIMEKPSLLILDEPFNSLDQTWKDWMKRKIIQYASSDNLIILTSHRKEDIDMLCNVIYHFENGMVTCTKNAENQHLMNCK